MLIPQSRFHCHFTILDPIGRGAFGTVFEAERKSDRKKFAVKFFAN
jgi:serine/threonine protein kinase